MVVISLIAAFVVGAALATSGAILQGVLRNPLAEPYMLGIVGGASLFATIAAMFFPDLLGSWTLPIASFLGAFVSLTLVFLVSAAANRLRRIASTDAQLRSSHSTFILAGFAVASFTGSLQMLLVSYAPPELFKSLYSRLFGTISQITPSQLIAATAILCIAFASEYAFHRHLNVMELGLDEAECLGINTKLTLFWVIFIVSLVTAVAVALAGAIGFVGLVVPHFVRRIFGPKMQILLILSALFGGFFLFISQFVAQSLPGNLPAGIIAALLLSPLFLLLLITYKNGEGRDV